MTTYKDEIQTRDWSPEDVEMQERTTEDLQIEQQERLLQNEDVEEPDKDLAHKVEWHLRTRWAVAASILAVLLVFAALIAFIKIFTAHQAARHKGQALSGEGFRRPPSDYILDSAWDFKASPTRRELKWNIVDIVGNPDGVSRPLLTINGLFPGPLIECNDGDTIVIEVENQSVNATSIHFHGLYQNGTNWMDGTTGVTQCPIAPGRKFTYEFTVEGQSGTYYYHGHQAVQASDGLYGPLVVHSRDEQMLQDDPYTSDRVVMLQDYYYDLSSGLLRSTLEPGNEGSPIPDSALMNGLNKRDCSSPAIQDRMCDNSTASLPTLHLAKNLRHRLRFINVGAFAWFQVSVDEHDFFVTEVDGTPILPALEKRLMIGPAQRYSMVLNAAQTKQNSFWLRARMMTHCWKEPDLPGPGADTVRAIIQYTEPGSRKYEFRTNEAISPEPTSKSTQAVEVQCKDMNTTYYIPSISQPPPEKADHSYYIRSNLEIGDWRLERGFFNTSSFRPNISDPTLHRTLASLQSQNETIKTASLNTNGVNSISYSSPSEFVIQHNGIKTIDLVIQNFDEGNHPMHLHGHKFWVLGQGHGMFPGYQTLGLQPFGAGLLPQKSPISPKTKDRHILDNRIRRDVASVEGFGWIVIRFVADNPGVWAFHCHMAWHSEAGLAMLFVDRVDTLEGLSLPEVNRELCKVDVKELEKGAVPKDEIWYGFGVGR